MAEKNFVLLSEVEQIEEVSEEATVLVVDNGVVKQTPKTSVGGSGSFRMLLNMDECESSNGAIMCSTNYDELAMALDAGDSVSIIFPADYTGAIPIVMAVLGWSYLATDNMLQVIVSAMSDSGGLMPIMFTNGTYAPTTITDLPVASPS